MLLIFRCDILDMYTLKIRSKRLIARGREKRTNLRSSLTQDLRDAGFAHQSQAGRKEVLLDQNRQLRLPRPTAGSEGKTRIRTDCAISRMACTGGLADAINWSAAATITEAKGTTSGSDSSKHAGSFSWNGLSTMGNSRLADAYFSSIRVTASERMFTKCRRGDIFVEVDIEGGGCDERCIRGAGTWWVFIHDTCMHSVRVVV